MMQRVLVVTPWKRRWEMGHGAGVADDHYFIHGLTQRGFEVHYLSPRGAEPADVETSNYFPHVFPNVLEATERLPSLLRRPLWPILFTVVAVTAGIRVARKHPPSIVLGHTHLSALAVRILGQRLRVPSAIKLFGVVDLDRLDWSRLRYVRKNIEQVLAFKVPQDAWIILDDGTGGAAAARRHGVASKKVHELPNGINVEWAERKPSPESLLRYQIPPRSDVVLFMARLTEWKRPDLFLQAVPHVLRQCQRPVVFLLAGDGPMRKHCEGLAVSIDITHVVRFLGPVAHDDVPDLLSAATVFVSTNRRSNGGIPTCEAMVCGVPVVAVDVGETKRLVHHDKTGILVADGDLAALADAISLVINDTGLHDRIAQRARLFARDTFTGWTERVDREIAILEQLIARAAAARHM